jgi:23S rRNA pseudouridine2605 synthase
VADGRISIDGRVAQLGEQLAGNERVCVDGRPVKLAVAQREASHIAYYKPSAARDDADTLDLPRPKHGRWIDVATLDAKTSGLLVLTTDGELAHRLMRSGIVLERMLAVRLTGQPSEGQTQRLLDGVDLEDGVFRVAALEPAGGTASNAWCHVTLRESRQRGLRAAFASIGLQVSRVIRVRYGPVDLGRLRRGESRALTPAEVRDLYAAAGMPPPRASAREPSSNRRHARGQARGPKQRRRKLT